MGGLYIIVFCGIIQLAKILLLPSKCEIIWTFLYCSPFSYHPSNFAIAKVVALNLFASIFVMSFVNWFMASFLYCFPYSYLTSNYWDSNSCCSYTLFKALAKSNGNLLRATTIAIAIVKKAITKAKNLYQKGWQ